MAADVDRAIQLWADTYEGGTPIDSFDVVRVAGICGLGVLTVDAMHQGLDCIKADYSSQSGFDRNLFDRLVPDVCFPRWVECLRDAATDHPPPTALYPIREPCDHEVGRPPCFGQARKGVWSSACRRAAWGNLEPYGLEHGVKSCPRCMRPLYYWAQRMKGDDSSFRWTIDHVLLHSLGNCVCHFNLRAICPRCNSAKGAR